MPAFFNSSGLESVFRKTPFLWWIIVDGRANRRNKAAFLHFFSVSMDVALAVQIREKDILTYLQQISLRQVRRTTSRISPNRQQYKNGFNDELVNTTVEARDLARKSLIE